MLLKYDPWFQPLHRRVIIAGVCAGWLVFELTVENDPLGIWIMLAAFLTGLSVWKFFLSGEYRQKPAADDTDPPAE